MIHGLQLLAFLALISMQIEKTIENYFFRPFLQQKSHRYPPNVQLNYFDALKANNLISLPLILKLQFAHHYKMNFFFLL